ncbi:MAG: RimK/LysX family protein [Patescibacteria group bacterium]
MSNPSLQTPVIGIVEHVSIDGRTIGSRAIDVPAKIDTGADSSSIWATQVEVSQDGMLRFCLFGPSSEHYTGKVLTRVDFSVSRVKNSTGHSEIRYKTHFTVTIGGKKIKAMFNLSDRSNNTYKILIGRRTISKKFLVDVSMHASRLPKPDKSAQLRKHLLKNPYEFHESHDKNLRGA